MQIPEQYKVGLKNEEHFNLVSSERTEDKIAARIAVISSNPSWTGRPWTAAQLRTRLDPVQVRFADIIEKNIVSDKFCFVGSRYVTITHAYLGFTFRNDKGKEKEWGRFATSRKDGHVPAFTRRDTIPLRYWADMQALGFMVQFHAVPT